MEKIEIELTPMYENEFGAILGNKKWRIFTFKSASSGEFDNEEFHKFMESFKDEAESTQDIIDMLREENIEDAGFKQDAANLAETMVFMKSDSTHMIFQRPWNPLFELLDQWADAAGVPDNPGQRALFIMRKLMEHDAPNNENLF